ncbi:MAG: ABC transporter permease [Peptococcaceae bacterium]|nr:ABC transporter permease [Peptococcaceae bacterium]
MRSVKAIFIKQLLDIIKNRMVLIQFVIFPVVALVFTELVAKPSEEMADSMFVTMFACIYAGMTVLATTAGIIAEDRERRSLRFLIMAGVKPYQYLLGIGGVMLTASLIVTVVFGLMGGFGGADLLKFVAALMLGAVASVLLGATIGILSKNQQAAGAMAMPLGMILGFTPMLAMFNDTVKKVFGIFYTMQVDMLVNDFAAGFLKPALVILANVTVLLVMFVAVYTKKGLRS